LVVGGYDGVVHGLLTELDITVKLNYVVSEIHYSLDDGVKVTANDGSEVIGDFVICTIPLGVL